ncbi:MAG: tetratricopeptide repeat protein [Burkholderiales bacterium]|nr:tetratricopeptide repeat protein [Burkholderiales bacterium]
MAEFRALLLTDVVDSTKLSEAIGDHAMAEVWAAHDRVARDLLPQWRGREIDKTDGMLLMFDTAADAVYYALHYHHALADMPTPLKARAGLHVGPVILRENSPEDVARGAKPLEVDGLAKPTAARVMSLARGGQTLLTPEAREDLGKTVLKTQSHGHWQIKGVADPIELFEVGFPEDRFVAPSDSEKVFRVVKTGDWWMPVKDIPNNLPHQGTSFVGREREIDEVKAMLGQARLVTLLGMGGLGKTRLSLQVAAEQLALYPDGVWFLDLSPLTDGALVAAEAARVLDVAEEPGRPMLATLSAHLKAKRALLILDNCEHLIKPSADLAHAIVKNAPNVRMIASSREPLHVPGEKTYPILPLPVPDRLASLEVLRATPSVQLFVERAQAHKASFELNEREAPAVAELVARLEGIPLALELAAARVRAMSVADINKRLTDRYKILTGGSRVLQERQQTLRALVDWSYELLQDNEKLLLRRLAVFVGGFDLEAAEKVCGVEPIEDFEVLDLLGSLVDKSLVMAEEREEGTRYRMLETIRDYAADKLKGEGEEAEAAARHCEFYYRMAVEARDGIDGPDQPQWLTRLERELDNLRASMALALSGATEDPVLSVKLAVQLLGFWIMRGYITEGRRLVKAALEMPVVQEFALAKANALYVGAALAGCQSDHAEALQMLEDSLVIYRELDDADNIAATLSTLSSTRLEVGDTERAKAEEAEALALFRQAGQKLNEGIALRNLGQIALYENELPKAGEHLEQALAIAKQVKSLEEEGECELLLGEVQLEQGDMALAMRHFERALEVCRKGADKRGEANALWRLGAADLVGGQLDSGRGKLGEALTAFHRAEMWKELIGCLEEFAGLALAQGQPDAGVGIAAATTLARQRQGLMRRPMAEERWQRRLEQLREALGDDGFVAIWNTAWDEWETDDAIKAALSLAGGSKKDIAIQ